MGSSIWSQNWPITSHKVPNNIKTPIQKWDLKDSIKIINSEKIFFVLPASLCVHVGACPTVFVDEHTYVCTKIYTETVNVYEGESIRCWHIDKTFISRKKISFLPLTRQVKRVSYSISFNIFISIFQYLAKFKIFSHFPTSQTGK